MSPGKLKNLDSIGAALKPKERGSNLRKYCEEQVVREGEEREEIRRPQKVKER